MTKTQEIKLLKQTIKKFGPNSYIGDWLASYETEIVWCIKNDFPIDVQLALKLGSPR